LAIENPIQQSRSAETSGRYNLSSQASEGIEMTRKSMTLGAIFVLFAVPAQVTPASAVPEDVRTACLFEAYEKGRGSMLPK
jgi:hypothetical protein